MSINSDRVLVYRYQQAQMLAARTGKKLPEAVKRAAAAAERRIEEYEEKERDAERAAYLEALSGGNLGWAMYSSNKIRDTPPQMVADNFDEYSERNQIVADMGYSGYPAYLAGKAWIELRELILKRDPLCACCDRRPSVQVHHRRYSKAALEGEDLTALIGVCAGCHRMAEFHDGIKQSPANASAWLGFGPQIKCPKCGGLHGDDEFFQDNGFTRCRVCGFCRRAYPPD